MAAYDQVLAKLGSVSSPTLADAADLELKRRGKRKASTSVDERNSHVSVAAPPVETSNKKSKSSGASTERATASPMKQKAAAAEAEAKAKLHDTTSNSVAAAALPSTVGTTAAAKASHLARFGRRRAGKSVRRCLHYLPPLWYMSILHSLSSGTCNPVLEVSTLVLHVHRLAGAAYLVLMEDLHV